MFKWLLHVPIYPGLFFIHHFIDKIKTFIIPFDFYKYFLNFKEINLVPIFNAKTIINEITRAIKISSYEINIIYCLLQLQESENNTEALGIIIKTLIKFF